MSIMRLPNGILRPIAEAPRTGREVLCTDGQIWRVCRPKLIQTDVWEYFRVDIDGVTHTYSMVPTHFIDLAQLPFAVDIRELHHVA